MYRRFVMLSVLFLPVLLLLSFSPVNDKTVDNFALRNTDGKIVSLKDYPKAKGFIIVFTCNHCPYAKQYPARLNDLNKKYKPMGVPLIAISSADTVNYEEDSYSKMVEKSKKEHFNFPYLFDAEQKVAKYFAAKKTPHAFVIWNEKGKWVVKYNGAIDDNALHPEMVKNKYVADAVDALLNDKEVTTKETRSIGCQINFRK